MTMSRQAEAVLASFLEDPSVSRFGLEVSRASGLASGTIYPILARFEEAGWLQSEWEAIDASTAGRPVRRLYRLTAEGEEAGRRHVEASLARLARVASALSLGWGAA
jgi:DNA-binding PadR family transcriptional regulator